MHIRVSVHGEELETFLERGEPGGLLNHLCPCTSVLVALQKHILEYGSCSLVRSWSPAVHGGQAEQEASQGSACTADKPLQSSCWVEFPSGLSLVLRQRGR